MGIRQGEQDPMRVDIPRPLMKRLAAMSREQRLAWLKKCRPDELLLMDGAFAAWAADGQFPPVEDSWRTWLMMAGRGYGKTRAGAEWVHSLAMGPPVRIALVGATIDEARSIMVEGVSGLLTVARRGRVRMKWEPGRGRLTWPRGSQAQLFSGENGDGLRGPEHHFAWCAAPDRHRRRGGGRERRGQCAAREPG